jgi:hypothetical protein
MAGVVPAAVWTETGWLDVTGPSRVHGSAPVWVQLVDALTFAALATAGWIALTGGGRFLVLGLVVPLASVLPLLYAAAGMQLVRHIAVPHPNLPERARAAWASIDRCPALASALRAFLATRPAIFLVALFAVLSIGLTATPGFTPSNDPAVNLPARFDAGWYAEIALDGYQPGANFGRQRNTAFFPALPMLMRPVGAVFGMYQDGLPRNQQLVRALWAGVVISLAAFLWALVYVIRLAEPLVGRDHAAAAALLLAAYPFAFFFNAPYTEALFLLGAAATFFHFVRGDWLAAAGWGLLVGLTRPNGCFLSIPLAILAWQHARHGRFAVRLGVAAMPGVGMLLFTAYLFSTSGVWFAWARSHGAWGRTFEGLAPLQRASELFNEHAFMTIVAGAPYDALNVLALIFALLLIVPVFRRLGAAWGVFVVLNVALPFAAGGVLSMGRLTSTQFPLFLALATMIPARSVPAWAAALAIVQGLCAALFFTWRELY